MAIDDGDTNDDYGNGGGDTSLQRSYDREIHQKVIHPIFHFTAPEAGANLNIHATINRDRERFVPPGEEEDGVLLQPPMPPQFI